MKPLPFRAVAAALAVLLIAGCGGEPGPHDGPLVLITFDGLRADVVGGLGGEPGLTPYLDRLIQEADWAGRAISPSSWTAPAMASLWTGLRPWQHQVLHAGQAALPADRPVLPAALRAAGYRTYGFHSGYWLKPRFGYARGFDGYRELAKGWPARKRLADLTGGRELVWVHLPEPAPPWMRRDRFLPRVPGAPARLPARVERAQLEALSDPALPPRHRRVLRAMYRLNVAWADERLGDFLQGLRDSGEWDRTLLVVTSDHGEELGERGRIPAGGGLGRPSIEVPLVVKLPEGWSRPLAVGRDGRPGTARLWATLIEAAGGTVPPAAAPSLFRRAPGGALSELYLRDGANLFSWVEGDHQLLWESRFVPPGRGPIGDRRALGAVFARSRPLSGTAGARLSLEVWEGASGRRPVEDPHRAAAMAARLAAAWGEFLPREQAPVEELRHP